MRARNLIIIVLTIIAFCLIAFSYIISHKIIEIPNGLKPLGTLWLTPICAIYIILMVRFFKLRQFYNITIMSIISFVLAILLARSRIMSAGPALILGVWMVPISFFFNCFIYQKTTGAVRILKILSWFVSIILASYFLGFLALRMHWVSNNVITYPSIFLFVILFFGIVFNLPHSKYSEWNGTDKKMFFRGIAIPVLFVFIFITIQMLFPELYKGILYGGRISDIYWGMILN